MKKLLFISLIVSSLSVSAAQSAKTYCGWISNPTPANVWMEDAKGLLTISLQGGTQPEGVDLAPSAPGESLRYSGGPGSYGDSCGCIKAEVSVVDGERTVTKILKSKAKKLSACLTDKSISQEYKPAYLIHSSGKAYTECYDHENELELVFRGRNVCTNEKGEYYYLAQ